MQNRLKYSPKPGKIAALLLLLCLLTITAQGQQVINGVVRDAVSKQTLPFAIIKFGNTGQGDVADLNGKYTISVNSAATYLEYSYLGYKSKRVPLPANTHTDILLEPEDNVLHEVIVTPPYDKIKRILNMAIANRDQNNPDKYDWYQCHVYYKMIVDVDVPDSVKAKNDTIKAFLEDQHILMSETYSIRTWHKPQQLQEQVLASRLSGFKKSMFTSMVTDVLPFHSYTDYINLNGKDYHNPVSKGFAQYYDFNLSDEILQGKDTLWQLTFRPNGHNGNELSGTVYISSNGYAIADLVARAYDEQLKRHVRIEQQYQHIEDGNRWFPKELNYIIDWTMESKDNSMTFFMKGTSNIDSVSWTEDKGFRFDKTHTVKIKTGADEHADSALNKYRPTVLDRKEQRTYKTLDSLGDIAHLDRIADYMRKLPEGKVPIGPVDLDLKRLFSANKYENVRLGLGLQTNEKVIKWLSVGGWVGYGFDDKAWKYGAFAEAYLDPYKEFVIRAGYSDDIREPGRVQLNKDLDRNYLKSYLLRTVDNIKAYTVSVKKKVNYWNTELTLTQEDITPKYAYALQYKGGEYKEFTTKEASLKLRYAYAERTAPFFGYYYSLGSKYPIWYAKVTTGMLESGNMQTQYTQAVSAIMWHKHINRIGFEHFMLEGGKSWSDKTLPLSKLFAGNGYRYDQGSVYAFGGMLTIYPYEYYMDAFVNFIFRHDFDWKLYKVNLAKSLSSAPNVCLGYNLLYGSMEHKEAQLYKPFAVPDNAYHEVGLLLNNLVRLKYLNVYYLTFNVGYYYHLSPTFDLDKNGRVVFGLGVEF